MKDKSSPRQAILSKNAKETSAPRHGPRFLQRQHSVNVASLSSRPSYNNFRQGAHHRYSPPGTFHNTPEADYCVPPLFAGSEFLGSPQAKQLPPPPRHWIEQSKALSNSGSSSSSEDENFSGKGIGSSNSPSPVSHISMMSTVSQPSSPGVFGMRVNPLQLIAAVSGS
jgi:hypothetical protein